MTHLSPLFSPNFEFLDFNQISSIYVNSTWLSILLYHRYLDYEWISLCSNNSINPNSRTNKTYKVRKKLTKIDLLAWFLTLNLGFSLLIMEDLWSQGEFLSSSPLFLPLLSSFSFLKFSPPFSLFFSLYFSILHVF